MENRTVVGRKKKKKYLSGTEKSLRGAVNNRLRPADFCLCPIRFAPVCENPELHVAEFELLQNVRLVFQEDFEKFARQREVSDVAIYFCSFIARTFFMILRR